MEQTNIFDLKFSDILDLIVDEKDKEIFNEIKKKAVQMVHNSLDNFNEISLSTKIKDFGEKPLNTESGRAIQLAQGPNSL